MGFSTASLCALQLSMNADEALKTKIREADLITETAWRDDRQSLLDNLSPMNALDYADAIEKHSSTIQNLPLVKASHFIEIMRQFTSVLNNKNTDGILTFASEKLESSHYLGRIRIFIDSLIRGQSRYGAPKTAILSIHHEKACEVGVSNNCRRARTNLEADIVLLADTNPRDRIDELNSVIDLKPNIFGFGLNVNALIAKFKGGT